MVAGGDDQDVLPAGCGGENIRQGVVKRDLVLQQRADVIAVCGVVDPRALDLEEERLVPFQEAAERGGRHLGQGGNGAFQFLGCVTVDGIGNVTP